jgi:hypothetical protein
MEEAASVRPFSCAVMFFPGDSPEQALKGHVPKFCREAKLPEALI